MSQWFHPWQLSRPPLIHQVLNSSQTLDLGLSWGTRGLKDLTETDSTISRPWTSPGPDNHSQLATAGERNRSSFLQLSQREVKQMSITHSLSTQQDAWLHFEDQQVGMERQRKNGTQSEVKWAPTDGIGSFQSDVIGWHEKLANLRRWCMNSYVANTVNLVLDRNRHTHLYSHVLHWCPIPYYILLFLMVVRINQSLVFYLVVGIQEGTLLLHTGENKRCAPWVCQSITISQSHTYIHRVLL